MSDEDWTEQLLQMFWAVTALFAPTMAPPGTKVTSVPSAHTPAMALVFRCQAEAVREAFAKVEAGLPDPRDYTDGQIGIAAYNRHIMRIIQKHTTEIDRTGVEVQRNVDEVDERDRRFERNWPS